MLVRMTSMRQSKVLTLTEVTQTVVSGTSIGLVDVCLSTESSSGVVLVIVSSIMPWWISADLVFQRLTEE